MWTLHFYMIHMLYILHFTWINNRPKHLDSKILRFEKYCSANSQAKILHLLNFYCSKCFFFLCFWILPPITPYYLLAACSLVITFKLHINDYLFLLWSFGLMVCFVAILVAVSVIVLLFISRGEIKNSHVWVYIQFSCWWSAHLEIFVVIGSDTEFADPRNSQTMSSLATSLLEVTYYLEFLSVNL
jgi:hypothetical protein